MMWHELGGVPVFSLDEVSELAGQAGMVAAQAEYEESPESAVEGWWRVADVVRALHADASSEGAAMLIDETVVVVLPQSWVASPDESRRSRTVRWAMDDDGVVLSNGQQSVRVRTPTEVRSGQLLRACGAADTEQVVYIPEGSGLGGVAPGALHAVRLMRELRDEQQELGVDPSEVLASPEGLHQESEASRPGQVELD